ncbi:methylmalonyl-CoA mutase family protein [Abyssalbus ytuae]|uniref:Acyl-CoA mutase large subunit family protein n=1 Tax=Abyssalbus ytuae TaxID=2926907 RepID=A0A9E6ZUE2_9FLAO|nr:methylmalonyl-CoA mutase family protein [Abyssalbus ytuae]UOB16921.1 acyl-CoA mutase large subunit family protein [Abyssalbus ytuae]
MKRKNVQHINLSGYLKKSTLHTLPYAAGFPPYLRGNETTMYVKKQWHTKPAGFFVVKLKEVNIEQASKEIQLQYLLNKGKELLKNEINKENKSDLTFANSCFTWNFTHDFLKEIAAMRAARLVWSKIIKETGLPSSASHIKFKIYAKPENELQALMAVLGSADFIDLPPSLSHYLYNNTGINKPVDPLGGSIRLEELTGNIAAHTWKLIHTQQK